MPDMPEDERELLEKYRAMSPQTDLVTTNKGVLVSYARWHEINAELARLRDATRNPE